jgi:hypothetical protein
VEDNCDGNKTQQSQSQLKLIVMRDSSNGNEMWRKMLATKIDVAEKIAAEIH